MTPQETIFGFAACLLLGGIVLIWFVRMLTKE